MATIDTLQLSRVLRDRAGFSQDAAEATAEALGAAIGGEVATKADITALKADIAGLRTGLKADIAELRTELKADIAALRAYIDTQIAGLRGYIDAEIAPLKADMRLLRWQIAVSWALSLAILVKLFVH
ncbi:MAG: hypothetical protein ACREFH_12510 [Stellaceae bacterium]